MSFTRRLAAGLPAVGVTALAALALTGSPAAAEPGDAARAGMPAVMATPTTDPDGYGGDDADVPNDNSTDDSGDGNGNNDDDRGNPGYGGESPSTSPTPSPSVTTPTGDTDTVPPGGESPDVSPSPSVSTPGGGVSAGGTLPLTGAPLGTTLTVGAILVAGGAAAVWYTRRRREA